MIKKDRGNKRNLTDCTIQEGFGIVIFRLTSIEDLVKKYKEKD